MGSAWLVSLHGRPLIIDEREPGVVAVWAAARQHLLPRDAFKLRADTQHRVARLLVARICLQLDAPAPEHLETMPGCGYFASVFTTDAGAMA